jgi:O-antigen/teichoic acid export membrane protein
VSPVDSPPKATPAARLAEALRRKARDGLIRGTGVAFVIRAAGILLTTGLYILLARLMTQAEYGIYLYALNILLMVSVVAKLGVSGAAVRYLAQYRTQQAWGPFVGFLNGSTVAVLAASVAAAGLLWLGISLLPQAIHAESRLTVLIGLAFVPAIGALHHTQECLRGLKRIAWSLTFERVAVPIGLGLFAVLVASAGIEPRAHKIMSMQICLTALSALVLWFLLAHYRGALPAEPPQAAYRIKEWTAVALPLLVTSGLGVVIMRLDAVVIGTFGHPELVAGYVVADKVALLLTFVLGAVITALSPLIAEQFHGGDRPSLQRSVVTAARVSFSWAVPIAVVCLVFPGEVLSIFGPEYAAYATVLRILVLGQVINAFSGILGPLFAMTGHQNFYMKVMVLACVANVALLPLGFYLGSIEGVAVVKVIAYAIWNLALIRGAFTLMSLRTSLSLGHHP